VPPALTLNSPITINSQLTKPETEQRHTGLDALHVRLVPGNRPNHRASEPLAIVALTWGLYQNCSKQRNPKEWYGHLLYKSQEVSCLRSAAYLSDVLYSAS
jgi:hypothetical protein